MIESKNYVVNAKYLKRNEKNINYNKYNVKNLKYIA